MRVQGESYWIDEELSYPELAKAINLYSAVRPRFVLSHEAPSKATETLLYSLMGAYFAEKGKCAMSRTAQALQSMLDIHQPEKLVFGHYHVEKEFDVPSYTTKVHLHGGNAVQRRYTKILRSRPGEKVKIPIGIFRLGLNYAKLFADTESANGCVIIHPKEKGQREVHVGINQSWEETIETFLHETFECAMVDMNVRYRTDSFWSHESSDFMFQMTHNQFAEVCARAAEFVKHALPPLSVLYRKHEHARLKEVAARKKKAKKKKAKKK